MIIIAWKDDRIVKENQSFCEVKMKKEKTERAGPRGVGTGSPFLERKERKREGDEVCIVWCSSLEHLYHIRSMLLYRDGIVNDL